MRTLSISSLRANRSRECAPDDMLREAIHASPRGKMDCFVACARRNDGGRPQIFSSFCRQRLVRTSSGIGVSGKLVFQLVTPTSPT